MITKETLTQIRLFCSAGITNGNIPESEFNELLQLADSEHQPTVKSTPELLKKKDVADLLSISIRQLDRLHDKG